MLRKSLHLHLRETISIVAFGILLVLGGITTNITTPSVDIALIAVSVIVMFIWLPSFRNGFSTSAAMTSCLLVGAGLAIAGLQLIPLPPEIWSSFPGRDVVVDLYKLENTELKPFPLTLDPTATRLAILWTLPGIAFFLVGQKIDRDQIKPFILLLVLFAIASVFIGLAQRFQGRESSLYFFSAFGTRYASGFAQGNFTNRNFYAATLYASIPMLAAYCHSLWVEKRVRAIFLFGFGLLFLMMLVSGLGAAGSRAGIVICMIVVLLTGLMLFKLTRQMQAQSFSRASWAWAGSLGVLFVLGQAGLIAITRLAETDPVNDARIGIWMKTIDAAKNYFPHGSGFGTFAPIYQLYEKPEDMIAGGFLNHAHSDWLELVFEGGLPMMIVLVLFVLLFLFQSMKTWFLLGADNKSIFALAASISMTGLLLHSIVDYPLRAPSLMATFGLLGGFLVGIAREGHRMPHLSKVQRQKV